MKEQRISMRNWAASVTGQKLKTTSSRQSSYLGYAYNFTARTARPE